MVGEEGGRGERGLDRSWVDWESGRTPISDLHWVRLLVYGTRSAVAQFVGGTASTALCVEGVERSALLSVPYANGKELHAAPSAVSKAAGFVMCGECPIDAPSVDVC